MNENGTTGKKKYRLLKIVIGSAAAILPFVFIFKRIKPDSLINALHQVSWWTVPLLGVVVLSAMALQGVRWWILIRAFTREFTLPLALSVHFKSLLYSLFLPNSTVQEVVRSVVAIRHIGAVTSWSAAWINKITGILVSYGFSMYGIILLSSSNSLPRGISVIVIMVFVVMCVLVLVSFSKRMTRPFIPILKKFLPHRFAEFSGKLRDGIYAFRHHHKALLAAFAVTVLVQALLVSGIAFIIKGITGQLFLKECFAFVPLIEMISMAQPFTPNGVGVRDALVAVMFRHLGLSPEQLGTYIIISNMSILLKLVGVVPLFFEMIAKRRMEKHQ